MAISTTLTLKFNGTAVQRGLKEVSKSIGKFANLGVDAAKSIVAPFAQLASILGPAALVGGMVAFAKASSDSASSLENLKAQIEIFTGSASKTEEIIGKLRKLAVESPLELSDISEGAKMLLNYGVSADEVIDTVSRLSEVSAGSADKFQRLALAFGQASSIGRLMGTELRQFTEAGFNPLESIAKKTGETMLQLKKRMEDGKVTVVELKDSLKAATSEGGRFFGLNAKMSKTFTGQVSMMKDQWDQLTASFGTGMNDGLKVAIDSIATQIPLFKESFTKIGQTFGYAIGEAVNGDFERFVAIGELIGEFIKIGVSSVFEKIGSDLTTSILNPLAELWKSQAGDKELPDSMKPLPENSFSEIASANLQNSQPRRDELMQTIAAPDRVGFTPKRPQLGDPNSAALDMATGILKQQGVFAKEYFLPTIEQLKLINQKLAPQP